MSTSARHRIHAMLPILDSPADADAREADLDRLLDAYRAEILAEAKVETVGWLVKKAREYRSTGSKQHALQADVIASLASKMDRGAVRAFLGTAHYRDVIDERRAEVRRAILGDDLNPSSLVLDAQAYRSLVTAIEATMADPNRWDGDEDEGTLLARYIEWLAAGQPGEDGEDADAPPAGLAADTARRAQLIAEITKQGGEWTTRRTHRLYKTLGINGVFRSTVRSDLAAVHHAGYLVQHDVPGRRFNTAKGGADRG